MAYNKIALVTGANRGIGFEICKQLVEEEIFVILTARDEDKGKKAVQSLDKSGKKVIFYQLDVIDFESISGVADFVESKYDRLDILINNAGILIDENVRAMNVSMTIVQQTLDTNFIGPFKLIQSFLPLMKKNNFGRIVNISSVMGSLNNMAGGYAGYRISKTALNATTKILASELSGTNILINSMCPGWVRTVMGGSNAARSVEEGADTALWLSKLPDGGPSGKFFQDRKEIPW
jgi:NAD(P)-dependent dehydrogenase (short-subunit alcohol dehydrogenase family)